MRNKRIAISDALKDAKEMEKIMFYLHQNSYKVTPAHGVDAFRQTPSAYSSNCGQPGGCHDWRSGQ